MWVSPFRNLRIFGYLLLPEAFRSLSRLSSALSAKASTLRSFQHNQFYKNACYKDGITKGSALRYVFFDRRFYPHAQRDMCWSIVLFTSFSIMCSHYLGCLDISLCSYMRFSRYSHLSYGSRKIRVENTRFELVTSCLQGRRSPN